VVFEPPKHEKFACTRAEMTAATGGFTATALATGLISPNLNRTADNIEAKVIRDRHLFLFSRPVASLRARSTTAEIAARVRRFIEGESWFVNRAERFFYLGMRRKINLSEIDLRRFPRRG
jgi:hypothetical protein